jgi:hypothetical protein
MLAYAFDHLMRDEKVGGAFSLAKNTKPKFVWIYDFKKNVILKYVI